jgi:large subunit GTPase 1
LHPPVCGAEIVTCCRRLRIPRRPAWDESTTPDQLDEQERTSFYEWRRELASLEQDERLVLTPFEKNLEVWRQLWRVLERSDVVVQVVDARDPLTYRSEDLEAYALDLHPTKRSLLLLNKADLLPEALRSTWADHFDSIGADYVFWSAKAGMDEHSTDEDVRTAAVERQRVGKDPRARVLGVDDLLDLLEARAAAAAADAEAKGVGRASRGDRLVVGLTGYPNVGKSSTINALFGSKKTAVAPTPGKTKHFQTLNVTGSLCLCDCPGLVLPQYAQSKAEMVAAGVIPNR